MAYNQSVKIDGIKPVSFIYNGGSALTAPYLAAKIDTTTDNCVLVAGASDAALFVGIIQDVHPVPSKDHIAVKSKGYTLATAGGTITRGAELELAANGKLVVKSAGVVVAVAIEAAAADEYFQVLLK